MSQRVRLVCLVGLLCGCSDSSEPSDDGPFRIVSVFPADGAAALPAGAISIQFSQDADPETLADGITVMAGNDTLPVALTYEASTRTVLVSAPMLPGTAYQVDVQLTAMSRSGQRLEEGVRWAFTTTEWSGRVVDHLGFFGEATRGVPALGVTPDGERHLFYSTLSENLYATCPLLCPRPETWQLAAVPNGATAYPTLGIGFDRSLHLLTTQAHSGSEQFLWYGQCHLSCASPASWNSVPLNGAGEAHSPSLQVGPDGALHAAMFRAPEGDLLYALCSTLCTDETNWTFTTVARAGTVGLEPSLAIGPQGELHIASVDFSNRALLYSNCSRSCTNESNWVTTTVQTEGRPGRAPSLAIGPGGEVHIAYYDEIGRDLAYSVCRIGCTRAGSWLATVVDATGDTGREPSLALDRHGRVHVAYYDFTGGSLRYGTCSTGCEEQHPWRLAELDGEGDVGRSPALALANDRITIAYLDYTAGDPYPLKVLD